jgi:hypothetical protein
MNDRNDVEWSKIQIPTPVTPVTPVEPEEAPSVIADQAIKPETASATPVTPVEETQGDDVRTLLARAQSRMRRTWIPPDIVRHNRPSLLRVIAYAMRGDWGPKKGAWRRAGQLDAIFLAVPGVAILYSAAWVWERPSRRIAAGLLGVAVVWTLKSLGWL